LALPLPAIRLALRGDASIICFKDALVPERYRLLDFEL